MVAGRAWVFSDTNLGRAAFAKLFADPQFGFWNKLSRHFKHGGRLHPAISIFARLYQRDGIGLAFENIKHPPWRSNKDGTASTCYNRVCWPVGVRPTQ